MASQGKTTATREFEFEFGKKSIPVDTTFFTRKMCRDIRKMITKIEMEESDFKKVPLRENQTLDEWQEEAAELLNIEALARRKGESEEAHIERTSTPYGEKVELKAIAILNGLDELLNEGKNQITEEDFDECHWPTLKRDLYACLGEANCWLTEFAPKRTK